MYNFARGKDYAHHITKYLHHQIVSPSNIHVCTTHLIFTYLRVLSTFVKISWVYFNRTPCLVSVNVVLGRLTVIFYYEPTVPPGPSFADTYLDHRNILTQFTIRAVLIRIFQTKVKSRNSTLR